MRLAKGYSPVVEKDMSTSGEISMVAAAKFCSGGLVSSKNWFSVYIVIKDAVLRLYDDVESFRQNENNSILRIELSRHHKASAIKRKASNNNTQLFSFYVEVDNGVFSPTKKLKLSTLNIEDAEKICRVVNSYFKG